ncbi:DUF2268 domain-containing protein [Halobacillus litoralis]|uniref:DUF2268 domain-containing protein n=1 Tax=Halobacillus litoralis TaxID=45668 RepID=UPI001CD1F621|nr:DUF2268 domain-containing putative Zn-dependent protease [Halobacillus litoralis]MCA0969193.1 DUF2268 domain-containing protein [Halobacillus litoralis]
MVYILLALIVITACSEEGETAPKDPDSFTVGGQEFEVQFHFENYRSYIEDRKDKESGFENAFKRHVVEPFRIQSFGEGKGYEETDILEFEAPTQIDRLEEHVNELVSQKGEIRSLIEESIRKSAGVLPSEGKKVYHVFLFNPDYPLALRAGGNVTGFTYDDQRVVLQLHPDFEEGALKLAVAHEYHHTVTLEGYSYKDETLMDAALIEGKAEIFSEKVYPEIEPPLSLAFYTDNKEQAAWDIFRKNPDTKARRIINAFHFGDREKELEQYSQYKIGYAIMDGYLEKHPDVSVRDWTDMEAEALYEGSGLSH